MCTTQDVIGSFCPYCMKNGNCEDQLCKNMDALLVAANVVILANRNRMDDLANRMDILTKNIMELVEIQRHIDGYGLESNDYQ